MGLMFSRRRADAARERQANKAQAHQENHDRVKSAQEAEKPQAKPEKKANGTDSSRAK